LKSLQVENAPEFIDEIYFNELNEKVQTLLNELTPRQKEVFLLSREEGMSHDEIAKKLNITVNTVKKHISNSLSFLKSKLDTMHVISCLYFFLFLM
jgi:RNA polymerase sigma-70 factor (ECF subfamily)